MKVLITGGSGFIGTNLIDLLQIERDIVILSIDIKPPLKTDHKKFWVQCDLLNIVEIENIIKDFLPDACIHLAAETEVKESEELEKDYPVNTNGSIVLFQLLKKYSVKRSIIVSTQYVCGPSKDLPKKPDDFWPHTFYGKSKVVLEKNTREILNPGTFIIVRPTYVWGPYHFKNFADLVHTIKKRYYIHPSGLKVIRSYAYVKNVCFQLVKLLSAQNLPRDWYYVGDRPIDSYVFVNKLSLALINKRAIRLPRFLILFLAKIGDATKKVIQLPINSFRYKNMTTSYTTPMEEIFTLVGESPYSLQSAVEEYTQWYKTYNTKDGKNNDDSQ
jgi:nucleoside-diphosphate-sugar epimerase